MPYPILFHTDLGVTAMFCNSVAPAADFSLSTSMTFSSSSIPTVGLATIQKHTLGMYPLPGVQSILKY